MICVENQAFPYRGFMLDVARHYMPVADLCRIIEAASLNGMNRMHWHLTDDQGWRLEIKKYPLLTQVGSVRGPSYFGKISETENNCGFYTQEEVRRIVAFAREKGIEIVPEIEVPGHASAMLAAYPQFGCRRIVAGPHGDEIIDHPYEYKVITYAGVFPNLICAGRDDAVQFLLDILDEVVQLFPGPEIHIGGDEAVKMHWRRCPDCQRRMREEGLSDEHELQRWLVLRVGDYLAKKGKKTIVWNESLQGGLLPAHFIVQHWMGDLKETAAFMAQGGKVICSDLEDYYISRTYPYTDVYHIWNTPAIPEYAKAHEENLLGLECAMWSERVTNPERAAYLLFPRLSAVGMKATRPKEHPDWESFFAELKKNQQRISALGLQGASETDWRIPDDRAKKEREKEEEIRSDPRMKEVFFICDTILLEEALEKLLRQINMPWAFALRVMDCAWAEQKEFSGGVKPEDSGAEEMARQLKIAIGNRQNGPWKGLPEQIWLDTLKCFSRFVGEHMQSCGLYGFDRGFWTTRQINAKLFRVGELEYELVENTEERFISIHIPSDVRLEVKLLNESLQRVKTFLKQYFPAWAEVPIRCESWLLSPVLKRLLPASSRILGFQQAFDIAPVEDDAREAVLQWVYHLTPDMQKGFSLEALPENTSLQRSMKRYLLSGGTVTSGEGPLVRSFPE